MQQEGPHTPLTPPRAPEPCQCWTSSSCPQRRDTSCPTRHQPLFDFTGEEMVKGGGTLAQGWAPHGKVKSPSTHIISVWSLCMSHASPAQLKKYLDLTHRRVRKEQRGKQAKSFPALSIRKGSEFVEGNFWTSYLLSMKQQLFLL